MLKVILYLAISADGFIADKEGGVAWLDEYASTGEEYGYQEFYDSIDAIVFGKTTYQQVLTFGPWPYPGKKSYIFGDQNMQPTENKDVEFVAVDISEFMEKLADKDVKRLWLMGGAKLAESFYNHGLIDEYDFAVMPKKLGEGIPLAKPIVQADGMKLTNEVRWPSGVMRKIYTKE
jgi:dihydrofolate reductase